MRSIPITEVSLEFSYFSRSHDRDLFLGRLDVQLDRIFLGPHSPDDGCNYGTIYELDTKADFIADDLAAAIDLILNGSRQATNDFLVPGLSV
jgi:hypothetical protein